MQKNIFGEQQVICKFSQVALHKRARTVVLWQQKPDKLNKGPAKCCGADSFAH